MSVWPPETIPGIIDVIGLGTAAVIAAVALYIRSAAPPPAADREATGEPSPSRSPDLEARQAVEGIDVAEPTS